MSATSTRIIGQQSWPGRALTDHRSRPSIITVIDLWHLPHDTSQLPLLYNSDRIFLHFFHTLSWLWNLRRLIQRFFKIRPLNGANLILISFTVVSVTGISMANLTVLFLKPNLLGHPIGFLDISIQIPKTGYTKHDFVTSCGWLISYYLSRVQYLFPSTWKARLNHWLNNQIVLK